MTPKLFYRVKRVSLTLSIISSLLLLLGGTPVNGYDNGVPPRPGYHGQNDQLQYNPYANQFQRTQPGDRLQYNPHEKQFDYRQPGYQPKYNPFTKRWQ
jgi:hypothetical protein